MFLNWLKGNFKQDQPKTVDDALSKYGELLEKYPTAILDLKLLPTSKSEMKDILKSLYRATSNQKIRGYVEVGYMFLSHFQDGVGKSPIDCIPPNIVSPENLNSELAAMDRWIAWQRMSAIEDDILLAEWKKFRAE